MDRIIDPKTMFMALAYTAAMCSKDERTKVGAVLVGVRQEIISVGYNGFPRGADDDVLERQLQPEKYDWFEHAERNAIYNAAAIGTSTQNSTLYVPYYPCVKCMRAIIQSGIKRIVIDQDRYKLFRVESAAVQMAKECGIKIEFMKVIIPEIVAHVDGKTYSLK